MSRSFLAAVAMVVFLAGSGYVLHAGLFGAGQAAPPVVPATAERVAASIPEIAAPAPSAAEPIHATVLSVDGRAERRDPAGAWVAVHAGDMLSEMDLLRTGQGTRTVLDFGGDATVEVGERSELTVVELSRSVSAVLLGAGRISANARGAPGTLLRVTTRGGDGVAETDQGRFSLLSTGTGHVTVASEEGTVHFASHGRSVEVGPGEVSVIRGDEPPTPPVKIPSSLFLKVKAPPGSLRTTETSVAGEATPGAIVTVNGVMTGVGDDGHFETAVALREGENVIVVDVEDALGRRQRKVFPRVNVDSLAPALAGEVTW